MNINAHQKLDYRITHQFDGLTISDGEGRCFGGHLMPEGSAIYTTAEIVVLALPELAFTRLPCPLSGYDELVVTQDA